MEQLFVSLYAQTKNARRMNHEESGKHATINGINKALVTDSKEIEKELPKKEF